MFSSFIKIEEKDSRYSTERVELDVAVPLILTKFSN